MLKSQEQHNEAPCQRTRELKAQWDRLDQHDARLRAVEVAVAIVTVKCGIVGIVGGLLAGLSLVLVKFAAGG